jgi:hypothetical protein
MRVIPLVLLRAGAVQLLPRLHFLPLSAVNKEKEILAPWNEQLIETNLIVRINEMREFCLIPFQGISSANL